MGFIPISNNTRCTNHNRYAFTQQGVTLPRNAGVTLKRKTGVNYKRNHGGQLQTKKGGQFGRNIQVFHRNAVQTWSDLVTFSPTTNYNFTTAATQAFGANQKEVVPGSGVWAFYSGDIAPQDELIDVTDQGLIDNDIFNFVTGYVPTDITGDNLVDVTDQGIVDNNIFNFIGSIHP